MQITPQNLSVLITNSLRLGYKVFTDNRLPLNLNIHAIRNLHNPQQNRFDDVLLVFWKDPENRWTYKYWRCTTDPGTHYLLDPINPLGTAAYAEGQYLGSHKVGIHGYSFPKWKHTALEQVGRVKAYRDNNRDSIFDYDPSQITEGANYKMNIHRASRWAEAQEVGKWSAGCIVVPNPDDFAVFISLCKEAAEIWGNSFSLTVHNSNVFND